MERTGLVVNKSKIDRNGVFATQDFKKGSVVYVLDGKPMSLAVIEGIFLHGFTRISADGFQISDKKYLFLDEFSDFINHSCDPACGVIKKGTLVALRDIQEGEEITYDYSTVEWTPREYQMYDYREWPMSCRCSKTNCRKLITCFPYLPAQIKKRYTALGMLPDHIKRKMALPVSKTACTVCEHVLRRSKMSKASQLDMLQYLHDAHAELPHTVSDPDTAPILGR